MKKLCGLFVMLFALVGISFATSPHKMITLYPGWNVVSTPAILSGIVFSNGGEGISFSKLSNGEWISVAATAENIKPLDGFMVYNNNSQNVSMALEYKTVAPTESFLQRNLNYGWDFLGVVTTTSPFSNIGDAATMSVDFTNNGTTNYLNKVNTNYLWNSTSSSINNPELGEAYGIFINQENAVYGAINNGGVEIPNCSNSGSAVINAGATKATVLKKAAGAEIAQFTLKSSNNACGVRLDTISFTLTGSTEFATFDEYDVTLRIAGITEDIIVTTGAYSINVSASPYVTLPSEGLTVKITTEKELTGTITLTGLKLNGTPNSRTFSKRFEDALVRIVAQQDVGGATKFTLEVDADSDVTVSDFKYELNGTGGLLTGVAGDFNDGETFEVAGIADVVQYVTQIQYSVNGSPIAVINKDEYNDFFKIGDTYIRVFKA